MTKRYTEEQFVKILKEVEATGKPAEACRKYGVGDGTIYNWRKRYGGLELSDLRRLKTLEEENRRLKKIENAARLVMKAFSNSIDYDSWDKALDALEVVLKEKP